MKLLALDTSSVACTAALRSGSRILERHELQPKEHARLLVPMLEGLLAEADLRPADLDAVVLGNGPGSFIGLRIGAAVAQGLCYGARLPLVPVSSLAAVALEAFRVSAAERVLVAQDAHREEVYLARYRRGEGDLPVPEGATLLQPAGEPYASPERPRGDAACHAAGDGWRRYPDFLALNEGRLAGFIDVRWPRGRFVLELGEHGWRAGAAIDARALEPIYVRERVTA